MPTAPELLALRPGDSPSQLRRRVMRLNPTTVGVALVLAGLAQIAPGLRPVDGARSWLLHGLSANANGWLAGFLWAVSMLGLVSAGFDLLGFLPRRLAWRPVATIS